LRLVQIASPPVMAACILLVSQALYTVEGLAGMVVVSLNFIFCEPQSTYRVQSVD
jgi:hypothetical protein